MCRTEPKCVTTQNTQRQGVIWGYPQITPRLNVSQCLKQAIPGRMVRDGTDALPRYTLCQALPLHMLQTVSNCGCAVRQLTLNILFPQKQKRTGNFQRGKSEKITKIEHLPEIEKFNVQSVARAWHSTAMDRSYQPVSTELLLSYRINESLGNCLGTLMPAASEHLLLVALVVLALFVLLVLFVALCLRSHFLIQLFKLPLAFVLFLS